EVVTLGDVGVLLVLDQRLDLLVKVGPRDRRDVYLDAGVGLLEGADDGVPVLRARVARAGAVVGDDELEGGRTAANGRRTAAARGESQSGNGRERDATSDATRELHVHQVSSLCSELGRPTTTTWRDFVS